MKDEAADAQVKETRRILRLVQTHHAQTCQNQGATQEAAGLVDVVYHPRTRLPVLNFATPRKNTAWVSVKDVEKGLDVLKAYDRAPRFAFIEALFPPQFAKSLHTLGLTVEREIPLMVYKPDEAEAPFRVPRMPDGMVVEPVTDHQGAALWWYTWRNAHYEVVTQTADPVFIGQDIYAMAAGVQMDFVVYRYRFPVGVARVTLNPESHTGEITALSLMRDVRTPENTRLLQAHVMHAALNRGCTLLFTSGETEHDRRLCRENGFIDCGSLIWYAENTSDKQAQKDSHVSMAQSLLVPRSPR